jgi:hypothetical protein
MYHVLVVEQGLILKDLISNKNSICFCFFSIDNFIKSLIEHHHPGLEPLIMNEKGSITIENNYSSNPDNIYILFYIHGYEEEEKKSITELIIFMFFE